MSGDLISRALVALCLGLTCLTGRAQSEEEFGFTAAARILGAAPLVESASAQRYVNLVGAALAQRAPGDYKWRFGLVKTGSVNAFAVPGGFVLLTSGLVESLRSEDELAFVIAHEMAHVLQRHHYKVVLRQKLAERAMKGLQQAGGGVDAALSQASGEIYARGLDKGAEFDADRIGVELMTQAGYDPAAAMGVLERLQSMKGDDPRAELLFSTHPSPGERLDTLLRSGLDTLARPAPVSLSAREARFRQFLSSF